jgi:MarR family transcriptional regulator, transcriptional regulator for hemolysin
MSEHEPRPQRRELIYRLVETARHVRTHVDQVAREHGTTRAQWGLLARLRRMAGPSQIDLAEDMELTPIAVGRLVDRLAEQGMIERRPHERDRRINRLYLSESGRKVVDGLDPLRETIAAGALDGVPDADVQLALDVLARIADNVRNRIADQAKRDRLGAARAAS